MKKIYNGKRYDTSTATQVASYDNGLGHREMQFVEEILYRTQKGAWFLYGQGGAMTRWSQPAGDMRGSGSDIAVLSENEAQQWLEDHGKDEALEKYFTIEDA